MRKAFLCIGLLTTLRLASAQLAPNTDFTVQLNPPGINTKTAAENDEIRARVLRPEVYAGYELVGRIVKSNKSGKLKGKTMIAFRFERLEQGGRTIWVSGVLKQVTNSKGAPNVDEEGHAIKSKNNYGKVAAASAVGALVGGLAGGAKGALIGAGAGGAAAVLFVEVAASDGADFQLAPNSVLLVTLSPQQGHPVQSTTSTSAVPSNSVPVISNGAPGARSFYVRHDHGTRAGSWQYCEGVLSVFSDHVNFQVSSSTDRRNDSFNLPLEEIQEVKANLMTIMHARAFHLRSKTGATLNFVPVHVSVAEVIESFPAHSAEGSWGHQ